MCPLTVFQFLEGATIEVDQIHTHMRPLLMMLGDYRSLTLNVVNRLTSVTRLFPNSFNDKFCDQMMVSSILLSVSLLSYLTALVSYSLGGGCPQRQAAPCIFIMDVVVAVMGIKLVTVMFIRTEICSCTPSQPVLGKLLTKCSILPVTPH